MTKKPTKPDNKLDIHYDSILGDISNIIDAARKSAARSINSIMTAAYWLIGRRVVEFEQKGSERADYGEELLKRLSGDLTSAYGRGFAKKQSISDTILLLGHFPDTVWKICQPPLPQSRQAGQTKRGSKRHERKEERKKTTET